MPETTETNRDENGKFKPGFSGNPAGRPVGSVSIIGKIKQIWEENPDQFQAYVAEVMKDPKLRQELIRQVDGAPKQAMDITSAGQPLSIQISEAVASKNGLHNESSPLQSSD